MSSIVDRNNAIPNGGVLAWTQVLAGFLSAFSSWGFINTFGEYQTYYKLNILSDLPDSTISWIGSIQIFFGLSFGLITGRLIDAGYVNLLLWGGTFLVTFGIMMASLSTEFYQLFLSQGVCVGIGCSCLYIASLGIVASYFSTKRALAFGIIAAGSSVGGVIFPIMVNRLVPLLGFPWATRVIGFTNLGVCIISCILLKPRLIPRTAGPLVDYASFRDLPFIFFSFGVFFGFMGIYVPLYYIESYAIARGLDKSLTPFLIPILNSSSTAGRIIPNFTADKLGSFNSFIPCIFCSAVLIYSWIAVNNVGGIIAFALLDGFFTGAFVSLPPACVAEMTPDISIVGTRIGMSFFLCGFGALSGAPIGGALLVRGNGSYLFAQVFAGTCLVLCTGFTVSAHLYLRYQRKQSLKESYIVTTDEDQPDVISESDESSEIIETMIINK